MLTGFGKSLRNESVAFRACRGQCKFVINFSCQLLPTNL